MFCMIVPGRETAGSGKLAIFWSSRVAFYSCLVFTLFRLIAADLE
jgi:hypothetical protein